MKTLRNDLTTIEQSKRLLELGVPKNSANHYYGKDGKLHYIDGTIPYSLLWEIGCTPCWSVGRLIEIFDMCYQQEPDECCITESWILTQKAEENFGSYIEYIIETFDVQQNYLDFSKLEE